MVTNWWLRFRRRFSVQGRATDPTAARVLTVVAIALAVQVAIMLAARATRFAPWSAGGLAVGLLGGLLSGLLIGTIGEWVVHRFLMHIPWKGPPLRWIVDMHRGHHWFHYRPDRYAHAGPITYSPIYPPRPTEICESRSSYLLATFGQLALYGGIAIVFVHTPAWLFTDNLLYSGVFAIVGLTECWLFVRVHDLVHHPEIGWMRRLPCFQAWNRHHYLHHIDNRSNTNFVLPFGDIMFGTWRVELTDAEREKWPDFDEAASRLYHRGADEADAAPEGGPSVPDDQPCAGGFGSSAVGVAAGGSTRQHE